jgi:hypothetical protein
VALTRLVAYGPGRTENDGDAHHNPNLQLAFGDTWAHATGDRAVRYSTSRLSQRFASAMVLAVLAATFSVVLPSVARGSSPPPPILPDTCQQPGAIVFDAATYLTWEPNRSRTSIDIAETDVTLTPGASYAVTLVSYDNHSEKDDDQPLEMWLVELTSASGDAIYTSNPTDDLPSDEDFAEFDVGETGPLGDSIATAWAIHAFAGEPQAEAESVWAVCALFEELGGPSDPVVEVMVEKSTNGVDADVAPGPAIMVGESVEWSYVVTNTGTVEVSGIDVSDDQGVAVSCPADVLAAGAEMTCTGSGTAEPGPYMNVGTVTASGPGGEVVSDDDISHYTGVDSPVADVAVEKSTNGVDADDPFGADVPRVAPGDPLLWEFTVTTTAAGASDIVVADSALGVVAGPSRGDADGDGVLDRDETWVYEVAGVAADLGDLAGAVEGCPNAEGEPQPTHRNLATVTATVAGEVATADDASHYCNTASQERIAVVLTDNVQLAPQGRGSPFGYRIVIANLGRATAPERTLVLETDAEVKLETDAEEKLRNRISASPGNGASCELQSVRDDRAFFGVSELDGGTYVSCVIEARVTDPAVTTVLAAVYSAEGQLLDAEPIVLDDTVSVEVEAWLELAKKLFPPNTAAAEVEVLADAAQVVAAAQDDSTLPATGFAAGRLVWLGVALLLAGLAVASRVPTVIDETSRSARPRGRRRRDSPLDG